MEEPIPVTDEDVREPNLLLRFLRKVVSRLLLLGQRVHSLETAAPPPSMEGIRRSLQATGTHPLYVGNLLGELAEPQPAAVTSYATTPTGQILQGLRDGQLVAVGSSSTGDTLYRVVGANPNTLRQINPAIAGSVVEVADTNFTVFDDASTSRKMQFSNGSITAGNTRVMTIPDVDQVLAGRNVNNSFTTSQTMGPFSSPMFKLEGTAGTSPQFNVGSSSINHWGLYTTLTATGGQGSCGLFDHVAAQNIWLIPAGGGAIQWLPSFNMTGKLTRYNAVTLSTAGNGVPAIVATAQTVATTSSVALTTVYTTPATPAFAYRMSLNIFGVTTGVSTGEIQSTISASNGTAIINITSSAISLQSTGTSYWVDAPLRVAGTSPIQLMISRTGTSTGQYSAYMTVEAL